MVGSYIRASTGHEGLDAMFNGLRLGDNVVWQVDTIDQYRQLVDWFVRRGLSENRQVHYLRFSDEPPLITDPAVTVKRIDPGQGFHMFSLEISEYLRRIGPDAFHILDPLTALLAVWRTDLAVANFFQVVCPTLFELDAVAYFGLLRGAHTATTLAAIQDTTQLFIDVRSVAGRTVIHPRKAWLRHSKSVLHPWEMDGEATAPVSDRRILRALAADDRRRDVPDPWHRAVDRASELIDRPEDPEHQRLIDELIHMFIGRDTRVVELARRHVTLEDLVTTARRVIGTGFVGGKTVGMLVARAILEHDPDDRFAARLERHDSFYVGSDLFYSFIIANGWWKLWVDQKSPTGYFRAGATLHKRLATGTFPPAIRDHLLEVLAHFGTDPIIVRSSSLLEDNFGNAFAGKYESVFVTNQGSLSARLEGLENAIRTVYASSMRVEALEYRRNRGLDNLDEQMSILIQRVSGARHGDYFFPHAAGVGNSSNLYVWDADMDPEAGMLRLVLGLGTRAVDRTITDYAKLVTLDDPRRRVGSKDHRTQRYVDVLSITENRPLTIPLSDIRDLDLGTDWNQFLSVDTETLRWLKEHNRRIPQIPMILDFAKLLDQTDIGDFFRSVMSALTTAYDHPVDIEYTINIVDGLPRVNLVQCRPLQTRGLGKAVAMPTDPHPSTVLVSTHGNFMGGNVKLPIHHVVHVRPDAYLGLGQQERYAVARGVGVLNKALAEESFMVMGPGRWGTTTPSLGIPVHFTELSNAAVIAEFTHAAGAFLPELSQGSHFFQDIVESGIFYLGVFDRDPAVEFNPSLVTESPNRLTHFAPELFRLSEVLHVASFDDLVLFSDIATQRLVCCRAAAS